MLPIKELTDVDPCTGSETVGVIKLLAAALFEVAAQLQQVKPANKLFG